MKVVTKTTCGRNPERKTTSGVTPDSGIFIITANNKIVIIETGLNLFKAKRIGMIIF